MFSRSADNPRYSQHTKSSIREPPNLDLNVKLTDDTFKRSLQSKDVSHYIVEGVDPLSFDLEDKFDLQKEGKSLTQRKSHYGSLDMMKKLMAQAKGFPFGRKSKRSESIKEQNGERNGNAQNKENTENSGNNDEKKEQEKEGENSNDDKGEANGDGKDNGGDDKKGDKDKDDDEKEKEKEKLKKEKEEEEKKEEEDNEEESDLDEAEVEIKELPDDPKDDPQYNILEDPEFKDLETKSEFGGDDEAAGKVLLDQQRKEFYDVLDKTIKIVRGDKKIERKIAKRELIPKCPQGGCRWRSAKFISESTPKEGEGVIWKLQFLDKYDEILDAVVPLVETVPGEDPGSDASKERQEEFIEINVLIDPSSIAEYKSMTTKEKHHELAVGEKVDILDIFRSRRSTKMLQKWRPATVIAENKYWIRIHFLGWGHVYDEWIHVVQQAKRISKFNQMTHRLERRINRRNNNFQKVLNRKLGYRMVLMEADGNCLFRTVAHQVYGNPKMHRKVREECCKYMLQNRDRFAMVVGDVTTHVRKMRKDREWGDDPEIRAMEEVYDRRFEIFNVAGMGTNYRPMKIHFDGDLPKKIHKLTPIRLSYHGQCHYNSIIPMSWKLSKKDNSIQPLKRRKTCYIKGHREKMMRKSDREEKKRKQNAAYDEKIKAEKERKEREIKELEDQKVEEKADEGDVEDNQGPEDDEVEKEREDGVVVVDIDEEVEIISDKRVSKNLQDEHHSGQAVQTITIVKTSSNGKTKSTEKKTSVLSQRSIKSDAQKHVIATDKEDKSVERSSEDSGPTPQKMKVSVSEAEAKSML